MKKFILALISILTACCLMINITFCCYATSFEEQLDELGYTVDEIIDLAQQKKFASIPVSVMNLMWKNASYVRDSLGIPNIGGIYDYYLNQNTRYDSSDRFIDSVKGVADTLRKSVDFNAVKDEDGNITESKIDEIYHVSGKIRIIETPFDDSPATEKLIQVDINAPKTSVSSSDITKDDCYGNLSLSVTDKLSGLTTSYSFPCCIRAVHIYTDFKYRNGIACNLCLDITYYVEDSKKSGFLYFGLSKTNSIDFVIDGIYHNSTTYGNLLNSLFIRRYPIGTSGLSNISGFNFGYITTYFVCNNDLINNQFSESYFGTEYGLPPSFNFDNKFSANTVINNDNALDLGIDINAGFLALGASFDASLKAAVDAILEGYLDFYSYQPAPGDSFTNITNNSYNYIEITEDKEPDDSGGGGSSSDNTEISNSILTNILNSITNLKNGFIDGIEYLFKPSDNLFTELQELIETKFDFVHQIIELGNIVITADFSDSPPDNTITIYGKEINFVDWSLYDTYKPVIDGIIIVVSYYFYVQKLIKRIPGIIGGFNL